MRLLPIIFLNLTINTKTQRTMNTTAKIVLFPQPTKQGYPLKVRIIQNRKSTYRSLKFFLTESQKDRYWNDSKKQLIKSYPDYQKVIAQYNIELKRLGINVSENINKAPVVHSGGSFISYILHYMENLKIRNQLGVLQKTTTVLFQLDMFRKEAGKPKDILFTDITIDFLNDFQSHLITKNILPVSQKGYIERLRSILKKAIKENKYNPTRDPFLGFEFVKVVTEPKCLSPQQFNLLKSLISGNTKTINLKTKKELPPIASNYKRTGLKFLFQYYCYGMRVSDLLLMRFSNIYESGKRLKYKMYKTKNDMDIILNNELLDILFEFMPYKNRISIIKQSSVEEGTYKYKINGVVFKINKKTEWYDLIRSNLYTLSTHSEYKNKRIFSKIPEELELLVDTKVLFSKISTYTAVYNKQLKNLSVEIGIRTSDKFHLSSHIARHTFAYLAMLSGQNVYYISQALNHKSIKTTEKYLGRFPERHLDGLFYKTELSVSDKKKIDNKLKELINGSDYEKKKKMIDLLSL